MCRDVRVVRGKWRFGGSVLAGVVIASLPAGRHETGGHDPHGGHVVANAEAMIPTATKLPRAGWTAAATSGSPASLLDGDTGTVWESTGALPQPVTVDMRVTRTVSGLVVTPRPGGGRGTIGRYEVGLSLDGTTWGAPVAAGTLADDAAPKTISFAVTGTRFVRLTALSEAGDRGPYAAVAELDVLGAPGAPVPMAVLDRAGWTAAASDEETAREHDVASNVLDGDPKTIWHSRYSTATPFPHRITLDLKQPTALGGLLYRPRAGGANGRVGEYRIAVSADGADFTDVSSGAWPDANAVQDAVFDHVVTARYVRLTASTEAGGRGPFTSAAEISLLGPLAGTLAPLSRVGWTASAAALLDNDLATAWRGTSFTVDTQQEQRITAIVVTPAALERAGGFTVATSTDGTTFTTAATGTWADDGTPKAVALDVSARHIRVTTAQTSSAVEFHAYGPAPVTPDPGKTGAWGVTVGFPLVPVASALLPGNKLLTWSAYAADNYGGAHGYTQTSIMDLATGEVTQRRVDDTGHDMFCPGLSILADGRVLVTGGSDAKQASVYDPAADTWTAAAPMNTARGYQSQVTLSTGEVFTVGGSWSGGRGGKAGEVYSPAADSWRTLPGVPPEPFFTADPRGVFRSDNHTWLFAADGGRVFQAGPSKRMHWVTTSGPGSVTDAGARGDSADAMNGNAVMYDVGKILTVGGAPAYDNSDATNRAYTIDITTGTAKVARGGDMAFARAFANSVVLPDGTVVVIGGQARAVPFSDQTAVLTPELWSPATGRFTPLAPMAVPRNYHSVANLLPDGRVFSGGGGLCGSCATNHFDGQVFTPPYLLNPDGTPKPRPAITSAPAKAASGATLTIGTDRAVTTFALMRVGSATHTVDTDQRRVPLTPARLSPTGYRITVPASPGVAPPGRYLLYALDAGGVPSIGREITIG